MLSTFSQTPAPTLRYNMGFCGVGRQLLTSEHQYNQKKSRTIQYCTIL